MIAYTAMFIREKMACQNKLKVDIQGKTSAKSNGGTDIK